MLNIDKINAEFDWNVLFYTSKNLESIQCTQISKSTHSSWLDKLNKYCISHFIYQNENIFLLFIVNGEELCDEFCLMCNQKLMFNDYDQCEMFIQSKMKRDTIQTHRRKWIERQTNEANNDSSKLNANIIFDSSNKYIQTFCLCCCHSTHDSRVKSVKIIRLFDWNDCSQ